jgi:hypothetical protein
MSAGGRPTKRTRARREKVLQALKAGHGMVAAATAAQLGRTTLFDWRADDAEFNEACVEATEFVADLAEHELLRRGMREGDTLALLAWLRAHRPEKYRRGTWVDAAVTVQHHQVADGNNVHFYMPPNGRDEPAEDGVLTIEGDVEEAEAEEDADAAT